MRCEIRCKDKAAKYPHGTYCPRHARMMAPRSMWDQLGVPYPEGQQPQLPPRMPVPTRPVRIWVSFALMYAPCPNRCGAPTAYLPGQNIPLCLTCECAANRLPERQAS